MIVSRIDEARFAVRALKLAWRPVPHTERLIVGTLRCDGPELAFAYDGPDLERAKKSGFKGYGAIEFGQAPEARMALHMFAARLPSPSRPDYTKLLATWGVNPNANDPIFLLAATGGKLPTDSYEFIPEVMFEPGNCLYTEVAGIHHLPDGSMLRGVKQGAELDLALDPANAYDADAVRLLLDGTQVAFLKKVLSSGVADAMRRGLKVNCMIQHVQANGILHQVIVSLSFSAS